jgi:sugar phosphate isomerase/epimerase
MQSVSRRDFLRVSAIGAGLATLPLHAAEEDKKLPISVQLYTLRDLMKQDFDGTLRQVAELGYPAVEFAGFGPHGSKPKELRAFMDELGITCSGSHEGFGGVKKSPEGRAEFIKTLGGKHLTVPSLPKEFRDGGKDGYQRFAAEMNKMGEAMAKVDCQLSYHNHNFEFKQADGKNLFEWMIAELDPKFVKLEVDVFWVKKGGVEPAEFIKQHSDYIALLHMKDMVDGKFAPVGTGSLDMKGIVAAGKEAGCDWYVVEQDRCDGSPLESIKTSIGSLTTLLA